MPGPGGLNDIPSNFDINDYIDISAGATAGCDNGAGEGKLRFLCGPSHLGYNDPIVSPGIEGAAHLHQFFGNTLTDHNSNYTRLRTQGEGTCAGGPINRTGYWFPAVIKPAGPGFPEAKVVNPVYIELYYQAYPETILDYDTVNPSGIFAHPTLAAVGFPLGFSYIFGWKHSDGTTPFGIWTREDSAGGTISTALFGGLHGTFSSLATDIPNDNISAQGYRDNIITRIVGPSCWDGVNITSANGRNHVAYHVDDGNGHSVCPATHPQRIPAVSVIAYFSHNGPDDFSTWVLSADTTAYGGDGEYDGGTTFHTDWFGGWDSTVQLMWETNHLGIGTNPVAQLTAAGGNLCQEDKVMTANNLPHIAHPSHYALNGWGSHHLLEMYRYSDIPTTPTGTKLFSQFSIKR